MSLDILRNCQNFTLRIQGESDWSGVEWIQRQAAELGDRCVEWFTADHKDHEKFDSMVYMFFALLGECYQRKIFSEEKIDELRSRTLKQIREFSQDIKDPDLLDFLKYNTSLELITTKDHHPLDLLV